MRNFNKVTLVHWKCDNDKHPFGSHMILKAPETSNHWQPRWFYPILSYPAFQGESKSNCNIGMREIKDLKTSFK